MNICILQHVPFEGAGTILPYFESSCESSETKASSHSVQMVRLYQEHSLPEADELDLLVIMGGPMSVHDVEEYPYLVEVKRLIRSAIAKDKWLLGICLGAQLIAEQLGAAVKSNNAKEIGWYPVEQTASARSAWLADLLPCEFTCLHWHGETFDIPDSAVHVARSQACENQAFVWNDRVIALQFHLEFTAQSTSALIERSRHELVSGEWIQGESELIADESKFESANKLMAGLLEHIEAEIEFRLHPQLEKDCHLIADFACSRVLLHKNSAIPWFILVPRGDYRDLDDMPQYRRHRLLNESDRIAALLRDEFDAEKINIAALGNMVPQLHLHVLGRRSDDPCWPNPVWGNLNENSQWTEEQLSALRQTLSRVEQALKRSQL